MSHFSFSFDAPITLAIAGVISLVACLFAAVRRIRLPKLSVVIYAIGLFLLCLAAGKLTWNATTPARIVVMIDVSSSTRTATYHDSALLTQRVNQLLGNTPYSAYVFSDQARPIELSDPQAESPARQTVFTPPSADAVVLFSDVRFALPRNAPPTFIVVDSALDHVSDAAVVRLESRSSDLVATIRNTTDTPRQINFSNAIPATQSAPPGETTLTGRLTPSAAEAYVAVARRDHWPENNSLNIALPPPPMLERWWITSSSTTPAPPGWRTLTPAQLSDEGMSNLHASVIALANVRADALTRLGLERIEQYVRDAGGGLMILGGDHAFAAGSYAGTSLEHLSPLSSNPPAPLTRWVMLIDSSGSMSAMLGDNSRWSFAANAAARVIPMLPPHDLLTIGDFARDVRWWMTSAPIDHIDFAQLIPRDIHPSGPTNLQPALQQLAQSAGGDSPTQLIVITDAEAHIDDPHALAGALSQKRIHVSLLSNASLAATSALKQLVEQSGGMDLAEADPRRWFEALRHLLRSAAPPWVERSALHIHFTTIAGPLPAQSASPWNHTWLQPNATELATGTAGDNKVPAVAAWKIGSGATLAAAYMPSAAVIDSLAEIVATPPRDPRFTITWQTSPDLRVSLDAIDHGHFLNDLRPRLSLQNTQSSADDAHEVPQTAPGHYELSLPAGSAPSLARLFLDGRLLDRIAVAGRYAPEFDGIGNDHDAMRALAAKTGGEVIEPSQSTPIRLPSGASRKRPLTTPLAVGAVCCIIAAIVRWRLG